MNCNECQEMLSPFLDGELDSELEETVAGHLRGCRSCSTRAGELRRLSALFERAGPAQLPVRLASRIRAAASEGRPIGGGRWLLPRLVAAGIGALTVGLLWASLKASFAPTQPERTRYSLDVRADIDTDLHRLQSWPEAKLLEWLRPQRRNR